MGESTQISGQHLNARKSEGEVIPPLPQFNIMVMEKSILCDVSAGKKTEKTKLKPNGGGKMSSLPTDGKK